VVQNILDSWGGVWCYRVGEHDVSSKKAFSRQQWLHMNHTSSNGNCSMQLVNTEALYHHHSQKGREILEAWLI